MMIEIVPATEDHIAHVIAEMREADRLEAGAMSGLSHDRAVRLSVSMSESVLAGIAEGEAVCLFGVQPASILGWGRPWLVGTPVIDRFQFAFLRRNRDWVRAQAERWTRLENWADDRNKIALRWLKWLGFTIHDAEPFGPYRLPFHRFEMRAPCAL